jgi:hypothetical protein
MANIYRAAIRPPLSEDVRLRRGLSCLDHAFSRNDSSRLMVIARPDFVSQAIALTVDAICYDDIPVSVILHVQSGFLPDVEFEHIDYSFTEIGINGMDGTGAYFGGRFSELSMPS